MHEHGPQLRANLKLASPQQPLSPAPKVCRRYLGAGRSRRCLSSKSAKKPRKAASGQKEMLMPIAGKKPAKETAAKKPAARSQRKSA
jgi:hypothetical protein